MIRQTRAGLLQALAEGTLDELEAQARRRHVPISRAVVVLVPEDAHPDGEVAVALLGDAMPWGREATAEVVGLLEQAAELVRRRSEA
jgi:hypothetical protein